MSDVRVSRELHQAMLDVTQAAREVVLERGRWSLVQALDQLGYALDSLDALTEDESWGDDLSAQPPKLPRKEPMVSTVSPIYLRELADGLKPGWAGLAETLLGAAARIEELERDNARLLARQALEELYG